MNSATRTAADAAQRAPLVERWQTMTVTSTGTDAAHIWRGNAGDIGPAHFTLTRELAHYTIAVGPHHAGHPDDDDRDSYEVDPDAVRAVASHLVTDQPEGTEWHAWASQRLADMCGEYARYITADDARNAGI